MPENAALYEQKTQVGGGWNAQKKATEFFLVSMRQECSDACD